MDEISFAERVTQVAIEQAAAYKKVFVDYEYLVFSEAFQKRGYYVISAREDNYQHLLGVNSLVPAKTFFAKCIDGTLSTADFNFLKIGHHEKSVKGSARRKIRALPGMMTMFSGAISVQESFLKNSVSCSFATSDGTITLGFITIGKSRPMTLLAGDELNSQTAKKASLILRGASCDKLFDGIIAGTADTQTLCADIIHAKLF